MNFEYNNKKYEVVIEKKNNKNTYIRVKEDLKIYVSTSYLTPKIMIKSLIENNIYYTNHKIGEEALYSMKLLLSANKISFLDERPVYYYVNHEGSQSKIKMDDPWGGIVDVIREYLTSQSLIEKYGNTLNAFSATATIISLDRIYNNHMDRSKTNQLIKKRITQYRRTEIKNTGIDYRSLDYKALLMYPFLKMNFLYPIMLISKIRGGVKNED